jgi:hypothetical protein
MSYVVLSWKCNSIYPKGLENSSSWKLQMLIPVVYDFSYLTTTSYGWPHFALMIESFN